MRRQCARAGGRAVGPSHAARDLYSGSAARPLTVSTGCALQADSGRRGDMLQILLSIAQGAPHLAAALASCGVLEAAAAAAAGADGKEVS